MRSLVCLLALGVAAVAACSDQSVTTREPGNVVLDAAVSDGAAGDGGGVPLREGVVRVAAFNVRRYFDTVCDSSRCTGTDFEEVPTQAGFDAKTEIAAKGIAVIQPDVIALAEIENLKAFDALRAKLATLGLDYSIAQLGETGPTASLDVAVLAKGSIGEVRTHKDTPLKRADGTSTTFSRELLEVRMTFGGRELVMFAAHFRSKVDDDPGRRLAEATATHEIVSAVARSRPDALVILGGDLNDTPGSPPINALETSGNLFRVASDRPVEKQATYTFQGADLAIDHIFIGSGQKARYVAASTTVYRDGARGFAGSDHGAISADFSIK